MPAAPRLPMTRVGLLRGRAQLARVGKGKEMVRRKREALAVEMLRLARSATEARSAIAAQSARTWPALLEALAAHGAAGLHAFALAAEDLRVSLREAGAWGVRASALAAPATVRRTLDARGLTAAAAGPAVIVAAEEFERLAELLLNVASHEQQLRRLADAVAQSSRHLHTLERRVEPALAEGVARVRRALEEREREEHHRLKWLWARAPAR